MSTDPGGPAALRPSARRRTLWVAIGAVLLVLAAAGVVLLPKLFRSDLDRLAGRDPFGASACRQLTQWLEGAIDPETGKPYSRVIAALAVSDSAGRSTTPAIKAAVGPPTFTDDMLALLRSTGQDVQNMQFTDLAKLHAGCTQAGVSMPAYAERQ